MPHSSVDVLDRSILPLLEVIAQEDSMLDFIYIKGQPVAYFQNRHRAAQVISKITDQKASYRGLEGESIDSRQVPEQPYENQNEQVAAFILDQIRTVQIQTEPKSDQE